MTWRCKASSLFAKELCHGHLLHRNRAIDVIEEFKNRAWAASLALLKPSPLFFQNAAQTPRTVCLKSSLILQLDERKWPRQRALVTDFQPGTSSVGSADVFADNTLFESSPKWSRQCCRKKFPQSSRIATADVASVPVAKRLSTKVPKQQLSSGVEKARGIQA